MARKEKEQKQTEKQTLSEHLEESHQSLTAIERLQWLVMDFDNIANYWDEQNPNYIDEEIEYYKEEKPKISKIAMYQEITRTCLFEGFLHEYLYSGCVYGGFDEAENLTTVKTFENTTIFPNILIAIGISESVQNAAKDTEEAFLERLYYHGVGFTEENIKEFYGETAVERYKKCTKLTENDYLEAFVHITELLELMEKNQYSQRLRESAWAIKGYCKLKAESPERYAEIEAEITKKQKNYSLPLKIGQWCDIFQVSENTLRGWMETGDYHFRRIGGKEGRRWALPKEELPAEYLQKFRETASPDKP